MALQVWLPLNGTTENQGLLGPISNSGVAFGDNGKIGKCKTSGTFTMTPEQTAQVHNNKEISICFWIYINAATGTQQCLGIYGNQGMGSGNNRKFTIFAYPNVNALHLSWMNDAANVTYIATIDSGLLPSYQWTHVTIVYKNPTVYVYINGELITTHSGVSSSSSFFYATEIASSSQYHYLNDFRVYNHALSKKEVKEIAKALVLHYPLNNVMESSMRNLYNAPYSQGYIGGTPNEDGSYNWHLDYIGTGSHNWPAFVFPKLDISSIIPSTGSMPFLFSIKYKINDVINVGGTFRWSRTSNDWYVNYGSRYIDPSTPRGVWREAWGVADVTKTSVWQNTGETFTVTPCIEFWCNDLITEGVRYLLDIDVKDVMIVANCSGYIPFIENSYVDNMIRDTSGYSNNGTKNGVFVPLYNSPRNDISFVFNGSDNCILTPFNTILGNSIEYTISVWFYKKSIGTKNYQTIFGGPSGYELEARNSSAADPLVILWNWGKGSAAYEFNKWNHLVITSDSSKIKLYLNGELKAQGTSSVPPSGNYYVGSWRDTTSQNFEGQMSDFRIYTTTLSAEDVLELYRTGGSVDKSGNLWAYKFEEE